MNCSHSQENTESVLFPEFAIMPDVFESLHNDSNNLLDLLKKIIFKAQLANLHKEKWYSEVDSIINSLSQDKRKKIKEILTVLLNNKKLVRHPKRANDRIPQKEFWLYMAYLSHIEREFKAVIENNGKLYRPKDYKIDDKILRTYSYKSIDSAIIDYLEDQQDIKIVKNEKNLWKVLEPVLRNSKENIFIVDPYIDPIKSYLPVLEICSKSLGQRFNDKRRGRIHIYTGNRRSGNYFIEKLDKDRWQKLLKPLIEKYKHTYKIFLLKSENKKLHARYIFTEQCGVLSENSWRIDSPKRTEHETTISLLSTKTYTDGYFSFQEVENKNYYKVIDCYEINQGLLNT